jgi:hypothetical protein
MQLWDRHWAQSVRTTPNNTPQSQKLYYCTQWRREVLVQDKSTTKTNDTYNPNHQGSPPYPEGQILFDQTVSKGLDNLRMRACRQLNLREGRRVLTAQVNASIKLSDSKTKYVDTIEKNDELSGPSMIYRFQEICF